MADTEAMKHSYHIHLVRDAPFVHLWIPDATGEYINCHHLWCGPGSGRECLLKVNNG